MAGKNKYVKLYTVGEKEGEKGGQRSLEEEKRSQLLKLKNGNYGLQDKKESL